MSIDTSLTEVYNYSAAELITLLRKKDISPLELVDASIERIRHTDDKLNAMPTLCIDRARAHAKEIMRSESCNRTDEAWLGGIPISVKDLVAVKGVRTTWGSPIYENHIPDKSDILVERLESNGAIIIGKSNTPEFGAGANTFNEVFGKTYNPWNTKKTCGGSSGGAAVSVASGQVWLATGSDLGGSLRIPASYCAITGLRPTPGRVPHGPAELAFDTLSVDGPMARNALDTAHLLDAMSGINVNDPISLEAPEKPFSVAVKEKEHYSPKRVAYSNNLDLFPVDPEVARICENAAKRFKSIGAIVDGEIPDFKGSIETFQVLRAANFARTKAHLLDTHKALMKPELVWNIEKGISLETEEINRAEIQRSILYNKMANFFANYDLLLCPTVIVPPFDVNTRFVDEVNGHRFDNYVDWLGITFVLSLTGCPAISTPVGFTSEGLPVGLQIIAPPQNEARLLAVTALIEEELALSTNGLITNSS